MNESITTAGPPATVDEATTGEEGNDGCVQEAGGGEPPTLEEILRMGPAERRGGTAVAHDAEEMAACNEEDKRRERQADETAPPSPFDPEVVALTVVPDGESPSGRSIVGPGNGELDDRSRLAGALLGIGGPLHRLAGPAPMDRIDSDAGRGIAFALANGSNDPVVVLMAQMAAAQYVVYSRVAGAAGRAAGAQHMSGGRTAVQDLTRSMNTLGRGFERSVQAVEMARTRARQRTSVPEFVVTRVRRGATTGGSQ